MPLVLKAVKSLRSSLSKVGSLLGLRAGHCAVHGSGGRKGGWGLNTHIMVGQGVQGLSLGRVVHIAAEVSHDEKNAIAF